jgi:hypothetical protein
MLFPIATTKGLSSAAFSIDFPELAPFPGKRRHINDPSKLAAFPSIRRWMVD